MNDTIHRFASMKIAISLLAVIVVAMAVGTIIGSMADLETASRTVYYSVWFRALLGLFALNVACSLYDLWPWGWQRAGYVLTHGSMLLILLGAFVTDQFKIEGRMELWEGEESTAFLSPGPSGQGLVRSLPFSLKLNAFEIDHYQGTQRPAMFRSRVVVNDLRTGRSFPAVIEMNRELSFAGYRFYQSSYQSTPYRDQTVLSVSRDPGQWIVFTGYTTLVLGMFTVFLTRIRQHRAASALAETARQPPVSRRVAALAFAVGVAAAAADPSLAATLPEAGAADALRALPVQHDGRVMPLDTLARETCWQVTGSTEWNGIDPVAMVLGWAFDPEGWAVEALVPIDSGLAAAHGIRTRGGRASFDELVSNRSFMEMMQEAARKAQNDEPLTRPQSDTQKVEQRLLLMQQFLKRSILRVIPDPADPMAAWSVPEPLREVSDLEAVLDARAAGALAPPAAMAREIRYNSLRPSRLSWWILLAATALSVLAWVRPRRAFDLLALVGLISGFAVMTWGIATRWQIAGRIPASNMYESMLFLGWGVGLFALVALIFIRNRLVVLNATAMSALAMVLTDTLPVDPYIHPIPPVLAGTPWLAIHVPIIMVSYSVLALGVLMAHMQIGFEVFAPRRRDLAAKMNELLYWYIHVGSILLIAGILTGSIWAASSWGRYWGWDPKEVWSLIAFLAYLGILHGRMDKLVGPFGVAALSIVAFWTILMTYVGVNFVLSGGLHSYGSGGGSVVRWLSIVAIGEAIFLSAGAAAHRSSRRRSGAYPAAA